MNKGILTSLLLLMGALCHCVSAQERITTGDADHGDATDSIRTSSVTAFHSRTITPSRTLDGKLLETLSSQSVADALRYFSGVQIKDYGGVGGLKTVNVRSLGAQHVGIFYDGIRITNAQNGQVDLGRYSLDNMEAVSLYNAQKSETLQSASEYASGSTVYLKTRVPVLEGRRDRFTARLKAGSFGTISPMVRYERRIGKVLMSAEAMYLQTDGDYRFHLKSDKEDTTGRRLNGDVRATRAELGLWAHPWGGDLQVHAYGYTSERGLPGPVIRRLSDQYAATDRQWDDNFFLQSSYRKAFRKFAFLVNAKGTYDNLAYLSDPSTNAAAPFIHNHYHQKDLYGSAAIAWYPADWISFNVSYDQRWSDLTCDVRYFNYVQRFDSKAAGAVTVTRRGFSMQASMLWTRVQDITKGSPEPLSRVCPSVAASWHDRSNILTIRSFYKPVFRAPTLNDLYYTLVGNAHLKPEWARQKDVGLDIQPLRSEAFSTKVSVDAFLSDVTDKIVAMPVASQFRWTMMNYGKVKGQGINASWTTASRVAGFTVSTLISYSYEESRERTDPEVISFNGQIPYTPWHSGSAVIGAGKGPWNLNASFLYTGARYRASDNVPENRLDPWMTADLSAARTFSLGKGVMMEAGLDLNNILGQRYEVVSRYPMPGRNFLTRLTLKF